MRFLLTTIIGIHPCFQFVGIQQAIRFRDGSLPMDPLRRDGVAPRALAGQRADHETNPQSALVDVLLVPPNPLPDGLAAVPGGVIPDQQQGPNALRREPGGTPGENARVTALTGRPATNRRPSWSTCGGPGRRSRPSQASALGSGSSVGGVSSGHFGVASGSVP